MLEYRPPYKDCVINGPYYNIQKDRYIINVKFPSGHETTTQYHRYLVEINIGRFLFDNEEVHHKDKLTYNNELTNLEIVTKDEHKKIHSRLLSQEFKCPLCNKSFVLSGQKLETAKWGNKIGKSGPYCSKTCAVRYSLSFRRDRVNKRGYC